MTKSLGLYYVFWCLLSYVAEYLCFEDSLIRDFYRIHGPTSPSYLYSYDTLYVAFSLGSGIVLRNTHSIVTRLLS